MSVYAVIKGKAIDVSSFSMNKRQKDIGTFDVELPTLEVFELGNIYLENIDVYNDGFLLATGFIRTHQNILNMGNGVSNVTTLSLKCDEHLGKLECEASTLVHFQNTLVSVAIDYLLTQSTQWNWALNNTSTLTDVEITLDLRSKETLWSQIVEVIDKSGELTYIKYGGYDPITDTYLLDIGAFGIELNEPFAILGDNIIKPPRFNAPTTEPLGGIFPVSGDSASVPINLDDALNIDPTLDDPTQDFQIIIGTGLVQNNLFSGCRKRKQYSVIKTENDETPTQQELNEAALALYRKAAKELQQSAPYYTVNVTIEYDNIPPIHQKILFQGDVFEEKFDHLTEQYFIKKTFTLNQYFRIIGFSGSFEDRKSTYNHYTEEPFPSFIWELELSTRDEAEILNDSEILYEKLEKNDEYDNKSNVAITEIGIAGIRAVTVNHQNELDDCVLLVNGIPTDGKVFNFTAPTPPANANDVVVTIKNISDPTVVYSVIQFGGLAQDYILCVSGSGGLDWTIAENITIETSWLYTI